jgi:hypothetical protein
VFVVGTSPSAIVCTITGIACIAAAGGVAFLHPAASTTSNNPTTPVKVFPDTNRRRQKYSVKSKMILLQESASLLRLPLLQTPIAR